MKTKLTLVMEVEFRHPKLVQRVFLAQRLNSLASHAVGEGLLTGASEAEVVSWDATVVNQTISSQDTQARRDLVKLLEYCQESEEKHYEEGKADLGAADPACKKHIWHTVKRLAKSIDHKFQ